MEREVGGCGEEKEVGISSRNLVLKEPNGVRGGVARRRHRVQRGGISFCSYLFKVNFILKYTYRKGTCPQWYSLIHLYKGKHSYRIRK